MNIAHHFYNEAYLQIILQKRYWLETVFGVLMLTGLFLGVFFGFATDSAITSEDPTATLDKLLIGFAVWMFASGCYSSASNDVNEELSNGTMEQLCIAPKRLPFMLAIKTAVHLVNAMLVFAVVLSILCIATGRSLDINYGVLILSLLLAAPSLIGVGYVVVGFILVHKKASVLQSLIFIVLIALVSLPAFPVNELAILPFALGASVAREAVVGTELVTLWNAMMMIGLNSVVYFTVGVYALFRCDSYARQKGTLSHT